MGRVNRRLRGTQSRPTIFQASDYMMTDFGQLRAVSPRRLLDLTQIDEINTDVVSTAVVGAATVAHEAATSSIRALVTGAAGDKVTIRTAYQRYTAGAAQRILATAWSMLAPQVNQRMRIGYFDDNDGLFFELRPAGVYAVRRTSTSGVAVDEATLTGLSIAEVLFHTIYEVRFRYLGHGPARFFVNTLACTDLVFRESNPFMRSARLPLTVELENTGASVANDFHFQCAAVESEGGAPEPMRTFGPSASVPTVGAAVTGLLAVRPKATYGGAVNRGQIQPLQLSIGAETQRARFTIYWKPTLLLPDAAWTSIDATSRTEFRTALTGGNAPSSFGVPLASFFVQNGGGITLDIERFFNPSSRVLQVDPLSGVQGVLMIAGRNEAAGTVDLFAGLTLGERS